MSRESAQVFLVYELLVSRCRLKIPKGTCFGGVVTGDLVEINFRAEHGYFDISYFKLLQEEFTFTLIVMAKYEQLLMCSVVIIHGKLVY